MAYDDRPQLPLTARRKALVALGALMFVAQLAAAAALAAPTTGPGDARLVVFAALWGVCVAWSVVTVLCIIRQAEIADIFTASLLVVVAPFALYALLAAIALRGTAQETDVVSAMFFGITAGALTAVCVWALALGVARALRLPGSEGVGTGPPL